MNRRLFGKNPHDFIRVMDYHALRIWVEKTNHKGQFCVLLSAIVHRSWRDSTLLTN